MAAVALDPNPIRVNVVKVDDGAQPNTSGLGVQLRLFARRCDGLFVGLRPQVTFGQYVEFNSLDTVGACGDEVDQQWLHAVKIGRFYRERGLTLVTHKCPCTAGVGPHRR